MSERQHICPITYTRIDPNEKYSVKGLKELSPTLQGLQDLPYTMEQQLIEARMRADKMSIQGVQPKISAKLNTKDQIFEICDTGGTYILKPQNPLYLELPENEDLTMRLADGLIEVPLHGLLYCADGKFTFFIKRFDRIAHGNKVPVEDFAQLSGLSRDTKYDFSMERFVPIIEKYCTFPVIEKAKLFTRVIFNYLIGNEDMHVKNYSLITRDNIIELAPAYDYLNTTIATGINKVKEQIALPLNGKKNNLSRKDIVEYYGAQKLMLEPYIIGEILNKFAASLTGWRETIDISFLSERGKNEYHMVLDERLKVLGL
jgi:serine/threonine-protein kinase HipA